MPRKIHLVLPFTRTHLQPTDIVFNYRHEESLKNNIKRIFALKNYSEAAEPIGVVSAHKLIHFSRIRGSTARFEPNDWRYDEQGRIQCLGGPLRMDLHTDPVNFNDLENGWPRPTPQDNYIEVTKVPFSLNYYIIANGNSRVFSTWIYYNRDYDAFPVDYHFHCKVNYSKTKTYIREAIKLLIALKPILFLFATVRIIKHPKPALRVCRFGVCFDIELEP